MSLPIPRAPDLETLYDVEGDVTPAVFGELKDRGIFDVDLPRGQDEAKTPRVELEVMLGAAISWAKIPWDSSDRRATMATAWNVNLVFTVVTDRVKTAQAPAHSAYRAKVRLLCTQFWTLLNTRMPYHLFEEIKEGGTTPGMINEQARNEDISKMHFAGIIKIRDGAWPEDS